MISRCCIPAWIGVDIDDLLDTLGTHMYLARGSFLHSTSAIVTSQSMEFR